MITFVCCYNNEYVLNDMLLPSLKRLKDEGRINFRTLLINTKDKKYSSAAKAFNTEINNLEKVENEILVFLHQDIAFDDSTPWINLEKEFHNNKNQILGYAGMSKDVGRTVSNLKDYGNGNYHTLTQIKDKTLVESVDECCFAITRDNFDKIRFDEVICDNWHLYAVNLCYQSRVENNIKSYVLPDIIYHKKTVGNNTIGGNQFSDNKFLRTLRKMIAKYKDTEPIIYTPCYICKTDFWGASRKLLRTYIKNFIHN